jgi:hypothetical protein
MKTEVIYNDIRGSVAADFDEEDSLVNLISSKGVDVQKYKPVGIKFHSCYFDKPEISILCVNNEDKLIEVSLKESISLEEYFNLFKHFETILIDEKYNETKVSDYMEI